MRSIACLFLLIFAAPASAWTIDDAGPFWRGRAFYCPVSNARSFPSRPTGELTQPCDDGDTNLFSGLLCAAGVEDGCAAVADALEESSGQWHRSPRIRRFGNDRGGSAFSPDMALGTQLYLIKSGDMRRAKLWLDWLHRSVPCSIELFGECVLYGLPRFCTDDVADKGCTMRPGDAAVLAQTVNYLQRKHGMPPLPDGRLGGYLGTFSGLGPRLEEISSLVNRPGFSQHLVGVSILLYRLTGETDARLDSAARALSEKNPGNAFFSFLAGTPRTEVIGQTLARCPSPNNLPTPPLHQWQWERDNSDRAWEHSCYWDCIFMEALLMTN